MQLRNRMAVAVAFGVVWMAGCSSPSGTAVSAAATAAPTAPVRVAAAVSKTIPLEVRAVGNVEPYSTITVKAQVGGILTKVSFQEGDAVHKGDLLFEIDARPYEQIVNQLEQTLVRDQAMLRQAQATLAHDTAQHKYSDDQANRYAKLQKEGVFSRDQAEQTRSDADSRLELLKADQASIESARAAIGVDTALLGKAKVDLSYCQIRSPIDGRTGNLLLKQGNVVKATDVDLVTIHQVQPIYITFSVPEKYLPDIRDRKAAGKLQVRATLNAASRESIGILTFIDNSVDNTTGMIKLKATFPNLDVKLWPGQFLDVMLRLSERANAVVIPAAALQTGQMGNYVFVIRPDNTVDLRPISLGPKVGEELAIDKGLQAGERVVTDGQVRLAPGMKVKVL
jgi:membrane fusion protein, multidrug efflux system